MQTAITEFNATTGRCFCGRHIEDGHRHCARHSITPSQLTPRVMQAAADLLRLPAPIFAKHTAAIQTDTVDADSADPDGDAEVMAMNQLVLAIAERQRAGDWPDALPPNPLHLAVEAILSELEVLGVTVEADGADLDLSGPTETLPPGLLAAIRTHKLAIYASVTGCLPLPEADLAELAATHSIVEIRAAISRLQAVAAEPEATIWHHQGVRDWTAVLRLKRRLLSDTRRSA